MSAPHPRYLLSQKDYDDNDLVDAGENFLQECALYQTPCIDKLHWGSSFRSCCCLAVFQKKADDPSGLTRSVARYMVYFCKQKQVQRQNTVIEWIKYAEGNPIHSTPYIIPRISEDREESENEGDENEEEPITINNQQDVPRICYSALLTILGYGRKFWNNCRNHAVKGTMPAHGLVGRPSNRMTEEQREMYDDLHGFIEEMKLLAEPTAMRFTREITGEMDTRDHDADTLQMPPNFTKRSLYCRFGFERGWKIETTSKGTAKAVKREDDQWRDLNLEPSPICVWSSFWKYWEDNFPNLKIGKPSEDIGGKCHKFANRMKYKFKSSGTPRSSLDPGTTTRAQLCAEVDPNTEETEVAVEEARKHVVVVAAARVQRLRDNETMEKAKDVCPDPGVAVINEIKDQRNTKRKKKKQQEEAGQKKKSRTEIQCDTQLGDSS